MHQSKALRIVYMGTPEFAVPPLRKLIEEGYNVVAVVTAPDKPAGRGLHMQPSAVKAYAVSVGLPVLQPEKLRDEGFVGQFMALKPDLGIVIAFRMLPEIIWSAPSLGTFNLHASLLPQYRGAAPINWAVINGEQQSGLTTFMLNAEIDKGAIVAHLPVRIWPQDTAGVLHDRLMGFGPQLVLQTIDKIASGQAQYLPQSAPEESLKPAPKIFKEDCRIRWDRPGEIVRNLVRGLSPYPAAWSELMPVTGGETVAVKIFESHFEVATPAAPGTVVTDDKTFLKVACADGYLYIDELLAAGKKRMGVEDFLRGFHNTGEYIFQ